MRTPLPSPINLTRQPIPSRVAPAGETACSPIMKTTMRLPLIPGILILALCASSLQAATINQVQSNGTSGQSWLTTGAWSNNAVPSSTNEYVSGPGMVLRSPTTLNSTFSGSSLTLNGSQFNATGATGAGGGPGVITIADLRATNGAAIVNGNGGEHAQTITGGTLAVSGSLFFRLNAVNPRSITIGSKITGSGKIGLIHNGTLTLNGAANTFSGTWAVGGTMSVLGTNYTNSSTVVSVLSAASQSALGINSSLVADAYSVIRVGYDWQTEGSVTLNLNSLTYLDTNWQVGALTINGFSFGAGTYTYSFLNSNYDAYFNTTGLGGSITVVPEPGSLCLTVMAAGALAWRRRRPPPADV